MPRPKQTAARFRRRLEVHYGLPGQPPLTGFTGNLSAIGMMIRTPRVYPPGSILKIDLLVPPGTLSVLGRVVWAREGPMQWLATGRIGMGIKFVDPPADLTALVQAGAVPRRAGRRGE